MKWLRYVELGLEDLLRDLNEQGFTTRQSCSGHVLPWGEVRPGWVEFEPGVITSKQDVIKVSQIVKKHTNVPFTVRRGVKLPGKVRFARPISPRPIPPASLAKDFLEEIRQGNKIVSSLYDVKDLEELVRRHEAEETEIVSKFRE